MNVIIISDDERSKILSMNTPDKCGWIVPFQMKDGRWAIGADVQADANKGGFWKSHCSLLKPLLSQSIGKEELVPSVDEKPIDVSAQTHASIKKT